MLDLSFAADKIIQISNNFFITNTVIATWVTMIITILIFGYASYSLKKNKNNYFVYSGKLIIKLFFKFTNSILNNEELSWSILSLVTALFLYITTANWIGIIPGFIGSFIIKTNTGNISIFKSINADVNTTSSMAVMSILLIKIFSNKFKDAKSYLKVGVNKVFRIIISFFEELSEFTRVISLSFRLAGNVFAGEVLMLVLGFLLPYFTPIPFMFLEFFIGIFQALIFSVLILIFVKW